MHTNIDLVFRTVGERTSAIALELAIEHIRPERVHILENRTPFWLTVQEMLARDYGGDYVVAVDADCLILRDLRPVLEANRRPHLDARLLDRFRGWVPAGVHVMRRDLIEAMRHVRIEPGDPGYYLKPESWIRYRALDALGEFEALKRMPILHDFEQDYEHLFVKYVTRDLRSRKSHLRMALDRKMRAWDAHDPDFAVARHAVEYAREQYNYAFLTGKTMLRLLPALDEVARTEIARLGLPARQRLTRAAVEQLPTAMSIQRELCVQPAQVFGIGLSVTSLKTLARALAGLGLIVAQNAEPKPSPARAGLGGPHLEPLSDFDAAVGIALSPRFAELDRNFPESRFILLIDSRDRWLAEVETARGNPGSRLARGLAYLFGVHNLDAALSRQWLLDAAAAYYGDVRAYFDGRPGKLMSLEVNAETDWRSLCADLERPDGCLPPIA
jgi:hypothetical protein